MYDIPDIEIAEIVAAMDEDSQRQLAQSIVREREVQRMLQSADAVETNSRGARLPFVVTENPQTA